MCAATPRSSFACWLGVLKNKGKTKASSKRYARLRKTLRDTKMCAQENIVKKRMKARKRLTKCMEV